METNWFYAVGQERRGPVPESELRQLIATGRIAAASLVWCEGMAQWAPANTIEALMRAPDAPQLPGITGATPPLPPGGPRLSSTPNRDLMAMARASLGGRWTNAVLVALAYMGINLGLQLLANIPLLGILIAIGSILITGALELGLTMYFLAFSRGANPDVGEIFKGFNRFGTSLAAYLLMSIFVFLWMLLFIIPGIIAALRYSMTWYILVDNPNMDALEAIRRSKEMMVGNKWKYFCLSWRFFGWAMLCVLTCGIGILWLIPYMQVSMAKFYDDLKPAA